MKALLLILFVLCTQVMAAPRFDKDVKALEARDADISSPNPALFIGSSTIRFWKNVEKEFAQYNAINRGFGGSQVSDLIYYADRLILKHDPKFIVIYSGDNDLGSKKSVKRITKDFENLINYIRAHQTQPIYILSIKQSPGRAKLAAKISSLNVALKKLCEKTPLTKYVDFNSSLLNKKGQAQTKYFRKDAIHMNDKAYKILNKKLSKVLEEEMEADINSAN